MLSFKTFWPTYACTIPKLYPVVQCRLGLLANGGYPKR